MAGPVLERRAGQIQPSSQRRRSSQKSLVAVLCLWRQCSLNTPGTPAPDHLGDAFLVGLAEDGASGAGFAFAVGSAAEAMRILRKLAAGLVANAFELFGSLFGQIGVNGENRAAKGKAGKENAEGGEISHDKLQRNASPPTDDAERTDFRRGMQPACVLQRSDDGD
jgi:hypothetical protein